MNNKAALKAVFHCEGGIFFAKNSFCFREINNINLLEQRKISILFPSYNHLFLVLLTYIIYTATGRTDKALVCYQHTTFNAAVAIITSEKKNRLNLFNFQHTFHRKDDEKNKKRCSARKSTTKNN